MRAGDEFDGFHAFNQGKAHIMQKLGDAKLDFICGVWDGIGADQIGEEYQPLGLYSFSQEAFQASVYPYVKQSLSDNLIAFSSWAMKCQEFNPSCILEHRPLCRDLSQLYIRQQTIRTALNHLSLDELNEYSYFVYCRYDITSRGGSQVSCLPDLGHVDIHHLLSVDGRAVILPAFNQLNEGYPDMWFYFNLSGLVGYANIFDLYAISVNSPLSKYQSLFCEGWPYSEEFELYNFNDPNRFSNLELKQMPTSAYTSKLAKYPRWQASNIHAFHKYFFALSPSPYVRVFCRSVARSDSIQNDRYKNDALESSSDTRTYTVGVSTMPLVVYTHSSYSDVLEVFVGEFSRYWNAYFSLIIACDADGLGDVKAVCEQTSATITSFICYDDSVEYSLRVQQVMAQLIDHQYVIFLHEDMVPTAKPDMAVLDELRNYLIVHDLSFLSITRNTTYESKKRVSKNISCSSTGYRYVVQPSFLCPPAWIKQLSTLPRPMNIWQLEEFFKTSPDTVYFCDQPESLLRGEAHYETLSLPHISTAITKGRWNFREYPYEVSRLSARYRINLSIRGCS